MRLIQHAYADDPWKVTVCCVLLNCTTGKQVRSVVEELFRRWPTPAALAACDQDELRELIRPLGFFNRRTKSLVRMSEEYARGVPLEELHGVGRYAMDAHKIVCRGLVSVRPTDGVLKKYLAWARAERKRLSMLSERSEC